MSEPISTETDIEQFKRDLTALKTDVAALVGHLKSTATAGIEGVIDQADLGAQTLYRNANAEGERAVKALTQQIEQQPLVALLIALGVGYIGGRLLSR
jgi:ElaB/YqjD/DUF883 family membrane-anchored ribosome-binding protein